MIKDSILPYDALIQDEFSDIPDAEVAEYVRGIKARTSSLPDPSREGIRAPIYRELFGLTLRQMSVLFGMVDRHKVVEPKKVGDAKTEEKVYDQEQVFAMGVLAREFKQLLAKGKGQHVGIEYVVRAAKRKLGETEIAGLLNDPVIFERRRDARTSRS